MRRNWPVWLAAVLALAAVAWLAVDVHAVRMALALVACLLAPGLGWARKLQLSDLGDTLALGVLLSLCVTVAVATTMVVFNVWSTVGGLIALLSIGLIGFVPMTSTGTSGQPTPRGRRYAEPAEVDQPPAEWHWHDVA